MLNQINKISFIGAGNMAQAIIGGLLKSGLSPERLFASARSDATKEKIAATLGIQTGTNEQACANAEVVILAVKPQIMKQVCEQLRPYLQSEALIISVAAGISNQSLQNWLGPQAIVRCMPNTPSSIGLGASGLYANELVSDEQKSLAEQILAAVGIALYVKEEPLIDAVTAVSGSGPAYFFLFIEAMTEAGIELGLDPSAAEQLAKQTAMGASILASKSELDVKQLRLNVSSPNGTTERAVKSFEANKIRPIVAEAMRACADRAQELSIELGAEI